jgi:methylmalonic aciduria homocystinuria type C protein
MEDLDQLHSSIKVQIEEFGFECSQPFLVGWYNDLVEKLYKLPFSEDTVAFLTTSTPKMFPSMKKYFAENFEEGKTTDGKLVYDPIDKFSKHIHESIQFSQPTHLIYDFESQPVTRVPKVLVQTCGHIAGVAYLYHPNDYPNLFDDNEKRFGVCVHPVYGGWFAFRGLIIFPNIKRTTLNKNRCNELLENNEEKLKYLFQEYNKNWKESKWRDILQYGTDILTVEKYEEDQCQYFIAHSKEERINIIMNSNKNDK